MVRSFYLPLFIAAAVSSGCGTIADSSLVGFPAPQTCYITTGDGGDIENFATRGQLLYSREGFRIPVPILGLISFADVEPEDELRNQICSIVREQEGDGLINLDIRWEAPSPGFLGFLATGGSISIEGTIINRGL